MARRFAHQAPVRVPWTVRVALVVLGASWAYLVRVVLS